MTPSDQTPKLPTWIFIVTDLAFLGAAGLIAWRSPRPFTDGTTFSIVLCLIIGAIAGLVPIVARYESVKNETLDDRQRALEALSRTISSSAEQISIAATGLHDIAELSLKNLRHAEHLPQKLQEKIAEFQAALATSNDAEKEELEKELVALRTTESERLESISEKISKSAADWAKLEATTQRNLAASKEVIEHAASAALPQFSAGTAAVAQAVVAASTAITRASLAASEGLVAAAAQAEQSLAQTHARAAADAEQSLSAARSNATTELEQKIAAVSFAISTATAEALAAVETKIAASAERLERAIEAAAKASQAVVSTPSAATFAASAPGADVMAPAPESVASPEEKSSTMGEVPAHPPKRPRKPRREQPAADEPPAPVVESAPVPSAEPELPPIAQSHEPAPVPADSIAEVAPITPATADPFVHVDAPSVLPETSPTPETETPATPPVPVEPAPTVEPAVDVPASTLEVIATDAAAPEPVTANETFVAPLTESEPSAPETTTTQPETVVAEEAPKPARKRAPKNTETTEEADPGLGLEIDDTPAPQSAELAERVLTSDGATRLIATAYIGIGNRLFIRGEGPGLSWEKGVPLQFVSIGKWRWETPDATSPVSFKLYKNDSVECTALGKQNLDPGHQQELTASF